MTEESLTKTDKITVPKNIHTLFLKRALDVILSGAALIVLSPLLLIVVLLEYLIHGYPAVYKTTRPGKDGKLFQLYKFRSMTNEHGEDGLLLPEDKRLTKFGLILRKLSVDELPELYSILKGDMSIIGPRPLLVEYLELYNERHKQRHLVRPGLACVRIYPTDSKTWTWREQFENDLYYIENLSLRTDIKMLFAVIREMISGAEYRANDTRVPFDGTNLDEVRSKSEVENVVRYDSVSK